MILEAIVAVLLHKDPTPDDSQWSAPWRAIADCETEDYSRPGEQPNWEESEGLHEGGCGAPPITE